MYYNNIVVCVSIIFNLLNCLYICAFFCYFWNIKSLCEVKFLLCSIFIYLYYLCCCLWKFVKFLLKWYFCHELDYNILIYLCSLGFSHYHFWKLVKSLFGWRFYCELDYSITYVICLHFPSHYLCFSSIWYFGIDCIGFFELLPLKIYFHKIYR